jgi:undecaprenyl diphosphate synthase
MKAHTLRHQEEASYEELLKKLDRSRMPRHIAVIMDGNRRWARERALPSLMGHQAGVKVFRSMVETCVELDIKSLTAYAFSKENWKRSEEEVAILLRLFEYYSKKEREHLYRNGVRFRPIGFLDELPESLRKEFEKTAEFTKNNTKLVLNLAVNYGSRAEIIQACKSIATEIGEGRLAPEGIDEALFSGFLMTADQPDPDLLIRTSGEMRISNFLLWQLAYTELWFSRLYWPDFTPKELVLSILDFQSRDRRFGGTKN